MSELKSALTQVTDAIAPLRKLLMLEGALKLAVSASEKAQESEAELVAYANKTASAARDLEDAEGRVFAARDRAATILATAKAEAEGILSSAADEGKRTVLIHTIQAKEMITNAVNSVADIHKSAAESKSAAEEAVSHAAGRARVSQTAIVVSENRLAEVKAEIIREQAKLDTIRTAIAAIRTA
jgi:hypothetical protein